MRKIKKINGYRIVRFNDRERRIFPELGTYGVIDAEIYTGNLELDWGEFEYEDADSLDIAIEQARGLASEIDIVEPKVTRPPPYRSRPCWERRWNDRSYL